MQFPYELLNSRFKRTSFFWSLELIKNYDLVFAISESTKETAKNLFSEFANSKVIYGGGFDILPELRLGFHDRAGLICVANELAHKNVKNLVLAYKSLKEEVQREHPLTVIGIRSSGARKNIFKYSVGSLGTISIPDYLNLNDLRLLYQTSRVLVMPSLSEGLSLPILEGWSSGLVAIGSSSTVAEELIQNSELLFDPRNISSIAKCMEGALTDQDLWESAQQELEKKLDTFNWNNVGKSICMGLAELPSREI